MGKGGGFAAAFCYDGYMFRTRDFVLLFVTIVFLVVAIGATILNDNGVAFKSDNSLTFTEDLDGDYEATVPEEQELSRAERLAEMRRKISEGQELVIADNSDLDDPLLALDLPESLVVDDEITIDTVGCADYRLYAGDWPLRGVLHKETEGARVFYIEEEVVVEVASSTGSSTEMIEVLELVERPLLQLPVSPPLAGSPQCFETDVIGVALDGSLIRNEDFLLYRIFDETTLIGYALDGWPIYGTTDRPTDSCGGITNGLNYGYYVGGAELSLSMLECFVSSPQPLN